MSATADLNSLLDDLAKVAPSGFSAGLHIRNAAPMISALTYPDEWVEFYTANAFALRDPTIIWGLGTIGRIRWSEIDMPDPANVLEFARDYGLNFGVSVACGPIRSRSIVGVARSDREFDDSELAHIENLVLEMHEAAKPPTELTKAQVEALRCIASGDRHTAAAAKLGISESALKARLVSARDRLEARTIPETIQRAKDYRLI